MCLTTRYETPCKIEDHYLTMHVQCMTFKQSQGRGCNNRQVETIPTMSCEKCYYHPPPPNKDGGMMGWRKNNASGAQGDSATEGDQNLDEGSQLGDGGNGQGSGGGQTRKRDSKKAALIGDMEILKEEHEGNQWGEGDERVKREKEPEGQQMNAERGEKLAYKKHNIKRKLAAHKMRIAQRKTSDQKKVTKEQVNDTDTTTTEELVDFDESSRCGQKGPISLGIVIPASKVSKTSSWVSSVSSESFQTAKYHTSERSDLVRVSSYKKPAAIKVTPYVKISHRADPNEKDNWKPDILIRGFTVPPPVPAPCVVSTVSPMGSLTDVEGKDLAASKFVGSHHRNDSGVECPDMQKPSTSDDAPPAPILVPSVHLSPPMKKKAVRPASIIISGSTICSGGSIPVCVRNRYADLDPRPHTPIVQTSIHITNNYLEVPASNLSPTANETKQSSILYSPFIPVSPTVLTKTLRDGPFAMPHIRQEPTGYLSCDDLMAPETTEFVFVGRGKLSLGF